MALEWILEHPDGCKIFAHQKKKQIIKLLYFNKEFPTVLLYPLDHFSKRAWQEYSIFPATTEDLFSTITWSNAFPHVSSCRTAVNFLPFSISIKFIFSIFLQYPTIVYMFTVPEYRSPISFPLNFEAQYLFSLSQHPTYETLQTCNPGRHQFLATKPLKMRSHAASEAIQTRSVFISFKIYRLCWSRTAEKHWFYVFSNFLTLLAHPQSFVWPLRGHFCHTAPINQQNTKRLLYTYMFNIDAVVPDSLRTHLQLCSICGSLGSVLKSMILSYSSYLLPLLHFHHVPFHHLFAVPDYLVSIPF